MGKVSEAAQQNEIVRADSASNLKAILTNNWDRMAAVMPKHMSSDRLLSLATSSINKNPKLAQCTPASVLSCFMRCSSLGIEPSDVDGLGRAYIIPYGSTATFILGYRGMLELARRSGDIMSIYAKAVYEGDVFASWEDEAGSHFRFEKNNDVERTPGNLTQVFMFARFKNGGSHYEHMTKAEVEAIRKRSKSKDSGAWVSDYEAMAKKTVVRRAFPYLPVSIDAQRAAALDETDGGYTSQIIHGDIVDMTSADAKADETGLATDDVSDTQGTLSADVSTN